MTLNERHICASQGAAMRFSSDALQAGCAAILYVVIGQVTPLAPQRPEAHSQAV